MRSGRSTAAAILVGASLLTACGGGDGDAIPGVALPAPAEGPVPTLDVSSASAADSPLPEVAVRQINGDGGWVQLKNELPADRPVLVWFWAPH